MLSPIYPCGKELNIASTQGNFIKTLNWSIVHLRTKEKTSRLENSSLNYGIESISYKLGTPTTFVLKSDISGACHFSNVPSAIFSQISTDSQTISLLPFYLNLFSFCPNLLEYVSVICKQLLMMFCCSSSIITTVISVIRSIKIEQDQKVCSEIQPR